jgi:hypothetical protein
LHGHFILLTVPHSFISSEKSSCKVNSKQSSQGWVWWCMSVIPAAQEEEVGGLQSEASQCKSARPYLKNKLKEKGVGVWLKL